MPGGRTPFGTRVFGSRVPIDPATQPNLEIYLSGRGGITPNTNLASLTAWNDQSGNARNFGTVPGGSVAPVVLTTGLGLAPGVSCISISAGGGGTNREIINNALPSFTQVRGSTQYALVNFNVYNGNGLRWFFWPSGAFSGPSLIYQATGFSFFGSVPNGHVAVQYGATGVDTGVVSPSGTWDLWTIVEDPEPGDGITFVYRNGQQVATFGGPASYLLQTECDLGGPSAGAAQFGEIASYLLYTAAHTAAQVSGIYKWFKGAYGI